MADRPIIRAPRLATCGAHGLTAVVHFVSSAESAEACPLTPRLRRHPLRIPPQLYSCGFLRRRVKDVREKTLGGAMFRLDLMTTGLLNDIR